MNSSRSITKMIMAAWAVHRIRATLQGRKQKRGSSKLVFCSVALCLSWVTFSGYLSALGHHSPERSWGLSADLTPSRLTRLSNPSSTASSSSDYSNVAADARNSGPSDAIHLLRIEGPFDGINRRFLKKRLLEAASSNAQLVLVQLDSPGFIGDNWDSARELVDAIRTSPVPVAVWIGPSGSRVARGASFVYLAGHIKGTSPLSTLGPVVPADLRSSRNPEELARQVEYVENAFPRLPHGIYERSFSTEELTATGLADFVAPTLGDAVVSMDELTATVVSSTGELVVKTLHTAKVVTPEIGPPLRQPSTEILFYKLSFTQRILHASVAPPVAYMLVMSAILLFALEFFTAGIGIVALLGVVCLLVGGYGLGAGSPNWLTLIGLGASVPFFAADIQKGIRSSATTGGVVATVLALAAATFSGPHELRLPLWVSLLLGLGYVLGWRLAVVIMIRTRFWAPVIAREKLIGSKGTVKDPLTPKGTVAIEKARFSATSANEELGRGEEIIVTGISGWRLVVERAQNNRPDK